MPVMPAHHLRRKPQPAGGWLISMGSQPSIAKMRMGLARPSIAQGFACLAMIAGPRLQLCFKGRCGHQIGGGGTGLFCFFKCLPARLSIIFHSQRLGGCRMDDCAAGVYFFAPRATARPAAQPPFGRLPISIMDSECH